LQQHPCRTAVSSPLLPHNFRFVDDKKMQKRAVSVAVSVCPPFCPDVTTERIFVKFGAEVY
jgi:hypothetical protein